MSSAVGGRFLGMWTRLFALVVASGVGAFFGLRAHEAARVESATPATPPVETAVDAPKDLLAEAVIAAPDATWRKTQTAVGGVLLLAPPTFAGLLGSFVKAPLVTIVDGASPAFAVMGAQGRWVIAAHVVTPAAARSTLVVAKLAPEAHVGNIELLHHDDAWVGLAGQYVLVGSDRDAITTLGPYAYRTLPARPLPPNAISIVATREALGGVLATEMNARIASAKRFLLDKDDEQRSLHNGRAPDLADPKPLVAIFEDVATHYATALAGMDRADVGLDVDDEYISAHVTLTPPVSGASRAFVDSFEGASALPLATANADAIATLFWRSDGPERERVANAASETLKSALGTRLPADDEAKIGESLLRVAKARAGWGILSVSGGASAGAVLRFPTHDAAAITQALDADFDLARKPSWSKWESEAVGVKKFDRVPNGATITMDQATVHAAWLTTGNEVAFAMGLDASALTTQPVHTIQNDAKVTAWLHDLHGDVAWALIARPLLVESSSRTDAACVAALRRGQSLVFDARATGVLIRRLASSSKAF